MSETWGDAEIATLSAHVAALAWTALAFLPALAWQAISEASRALANNRR